MVTAKKRGVFRPAAALAACWLAAFSLSCLIEQAGASLHPGYRDGAWGRLLGTSRKAFSASFFELADVYFHKGVSRRGEKAFEGRLERWAKAVRPTEHRHASGRDVLDIMPWLALATRLDPSHTDAYLVAAYWLANEGERPDLALRVLAEGRRSNPGDHRFLIDRALIHMRHGQSAAAAAALDAGLNLWPGPLDAQGEEARLDLARLLGTRAFLHLIAEETDEALALLRRELDLFPERSALRERIARIEEGRTDAEWARRTWERLYVPSRTTCRHGHDDHHGHVHDSPHGHAHGDGGKRGGP